MPKSSHHRKDRKHQKDRKKPHHDKHHHDHEIQHHSGPCYIRALHNVAGGPNVDVYLDNQKAIHNLAYKELTGYLKVSSKSKKLVVKVVGTDNAIVMTNLKLHPHKYYTMIVAGLIADPANITILGFLDKDVCPKPGTANVRFIHAAAGAPAVDIYANNTKIFSNVSYTNTGTPEYLPTTLGNIEVSVKVAGTNTTVVGPVPLYLISGGIYTLIATGLVGNAKTPLTAVISHDNKGKCENLQSNFDTQAYMGKWYQIASIPQFFNRDCARSVAEYTLLSDHVKVFNVCYNNNWDVLRTITGSAVSTDCEPASLYVSFPGYPPSPAANYLIHDTNYITYSIVGSPDRSNLYILSRDPKMTVCMYRNLRRTARELGYDITKLVIDYHALSPNCEGKEVVEEEYELSD